MERCGKGNREEKWKLGKEILLCLKKNGEKCDVVLWPYFIIYCGSY